MWEQKNSVYFQSTSKSERRKWHYHIISSFFLATLVALHLNPVSESVSRWAEFRTSVASRLASLFFYYKIEIMIYKNLIILTFCSPSCSLRCNIFKMIFTKCAMDVLQKFPSALLASYTHSLMLQENCATGLL